MPFSAQSFSVGEVLTAAKMNQMDTNIDEVRQHHKGAAAPPDLAAGIMWLEDDNPSATVWTLRIYDGADWVEMLRVDSTNNRVFENVGYFGDGVVGAPGITFTNDTDTGIYRIGTNALGIVTAGAAAIAVGADGDVTMPLQPAFLAYNSVTDTDVTGAGTVATVDFDTEVFDQGNDFAADTFTAPVVGRYLFEVSVMLQQFGAGANDMRLTLVTSNRSYRHSTVNPPVAGNDQFYTFSVLADMDAADTATVTVVVSGMAGNTVDIFGSATNMDTRFSGHLVA